jgi:hypothetical protein
MKKVLITILSLALFSANAQVENSHDLYVDLGYGSTNKSQIGGLFGFNTKSNKKMYVGFNSATDLNEIQFEKRKDSWSIEGLVGFEPIKNVIFGAKLGIAAQSTMHNRFIGYNVRTISYSPTYTNVRITEDYATTTNSIKPVGGLFIRYKSRVSPYISVDSFSGVSLGIGINVL